MMLRFTVRNVNPSRETISWKALRNFSSIQYHLDSSRWNRNASVPLRLTGNRSNLSTVTGSSLNDSVIIHDQGKEAFVEILRASFVITVKKKKSESLRQDKAFLQAFNDADTLPLMTSAVIEETLWSMIEEGENYPVTKAVRLLPPELCNNSILNAGILAFGRANKPNKGIELLLKFLSIKKEYGDQCGINFQPSDSALSIEYLLQALCEGDRLEQVEELLAQWMYLCLTEKQQLLDILTSAADSGVGSNSETEARIAHLNVDLSRINAVIPAFLERVTASRMKLSKAGSKSAKNEKEKSSSVTETKQYKEGDELDVETMIGLREEFCFNNNFRYSKDQEMLKRSLIRDDFFEWESTLDVSGSAEQHVLTAPGSDSNILLTDVFYYPSNAGVTDGRGAGGGLPVLPLPSDLALCVVAKMYAGRGAWDSCLHLCQSLIIHEHAKLSTTAAAAATGTVGAIETESTQDEDKDEAFLRYEQSISTLLAVSYRQAVSTLCSNAQYDAALSLTEQARNVGVPITPSCLAQLLLMFEINENLSSVEYDDGPVTLLDFQDEIFKSIMVAAEFDLKMHQRNLRSCSSSQASTSSTPSKARGTGMGMGGSDRRGYSVGDADRVHYDLGSTGQLILINIKLLCERGLVFQAEKFLLDLMGQEGRPGPNAGSSIPLEAVALLCHYLATRDQFERATIIFAYLHDRCMRAPTPAPSEDALSPSFEASDDVASSTGASDTAQGAAVAGVGGARAEGAGVGTGVAVLESFRDRDTELKSKFLPELFHSICNQYRRAKDFEAMAEFIARFNPR